MIRSALMTVMTNAAIKAGRGLKRDFGEIGQLQGAPPGERRPPWGCPRTAGAALAQLGGHADHQLRNRAGGW